MNKYYGVVHAIRYLSLNTVFGPPYLKCLRIVDIFSMNGMFVS